MQQALDAIHDVGCHLARSADFSTADDPQYVEDMVYYAASRQIKLIMLYNMDTPDMPLNNIVAQWQRIGPVTGSLWQTGQRGAPYAQWAPTHIEVGNEWSFGYSRGTTISTDIAGCARGVANSVNRFYNALHPINPNIKLICEGEDAAKGNTLFLDTLISTNANLRSQIDGWTIHPYGPVTVQQGTSYYGKLQTMINNLNNKFGTNTDKIFITEDGVATDDDVDLNDQNNYGFFTKTSYSQAATDMLDLVRFIGNTAAFRSRVQTFIHFEAIDQEVHHYQAKREFYFGIKLAGNSGPKGALTTAASTLASEFPLTAGSGAGAVGNETNIHWQTQSFVTGPNFRIVGEHLEWDAVPNAVGYKVYERDTNTYNVLSAATLSFIPATRPAGTTVYFGWTYNLADGVDHYVTEQPITFGSGVTAVGDESAHHWTIAQTIPTTRTAHWSISNFVTTTRIGHWALNAIVPDTITPHWTVIGLTSKLSIARWNISVPAFKTSTYHYSISNKIAALRTSLWDIYPTTVAFPSTDILDNFNTGGPHLDSNWSNPIHVNATQLVIVAGQAGATTTGFNANGFDGYRTRSFAPNQEAYVTVKAKAGVVGAKTYLYTRLT